MHPLTALPRPDPRRLAVRLTPDAIRHVRAGHPWVFTDSVLSTNRPGAAGDLAVVFDADRRFVAIGLWDPDSPIRIKVLHHGRPVQIDADWWSARLDAALAVRDELCRSSETTGYRCVNGENDGFPGLVLDRYASSYVLKVYSAAWLVHLPVIVELLQQRLQPERVVLRLGRLVQRGPTYGLGDGTVLTGSPFEGVESVRFLEHGLTFEANLVHGQKTGHFLDQRDNRSRVRDLASGASVLDVFACTGGFSVYAAAGGAVAVHSVDLSAPTLAVAERNMALNAALPAVARCRHTIQVADAFEAMRDLGRARRQFDVVVIDPPSFASRASEVRAGLQAYRRLTELGAALVAPGGVLMQASCSSRISAADLYGAVTDTLDAIGRDAVELARTGHALDHPVTFPQGAYLKAVFVRL
jgi:23S rRNA (cytosine1962-C5)-methyltransferase